MSDESDAEIIFEFDSDDFPKNTENLNESTERSFENKYTAGKDDTEVKINNFVSSDIQDSLRVCLDDFNVLSVIGKGAYGKVFLVKKKLSSKPQFYAMKVLKKASIIVHGKDTEHTKNERSVLEEVRHPFIVKLYYAFQTTSRLYLLLSYASGGELFSYLSKERMFSDDVARFYISELYLAIEHLHSIGIIYRYSSL